MKRLSVATVLSFMMVKPRHSEVDRLKTFEMPLSYFESTLLEDLNKLLSLRAGLWAPG